MGAITSIAWTDHTFNPWWGCVKVSPGCANCYAATFAKRVGQDVWGPEAPRRFFGDKHWAEPLKWNRDAEKAGVRRRVFCASMADVFEDRPDLVEPRERLFALIHDTPHLTWLLLTKRPENVARFTDAAYRGCVPEYAPEHFAMPSNVWLGTTCEDQQRADERIPHLLAVPAAVRFLSVEPMLGPVDLHLWLPTLEVERETRKPGDEFVDWVIVGGESGAGSRPCDVAWIRSVRDQCREAGVAVFVKQLGARAFDRCERGPDGEPNEPHWLKTKDAKGGDMAEWPNDLRVRQFPPPRDGRDDAGRGEAGR